MCLQSPRDINEAVDRFHEFLVRFLYCLTGDEHTAGVEIDQILPAAREARAVELGITTLSMVWPVPRGA